jgi:phosphonopyruvate decarboxylase
MIQAEQFIARANEFGYQWYAGVPCSFLTPFINCVIRGERLTYVSSANEGDAVAAAAGVALGGRRAVAMMQNSGLGNAVSPLTSLTYVFRIPVLLIVTWRGAPDLSDEPQHELTGRITGTLLEIMGVPWEYFPVEAEQIVPVLKRAEDYMEHEQRPYALIMRKGSVAPYALDRPGAPGQERSRLSYANFSVPLERTYPSRTEALRRIVELTSPPGTVVIATTGYTGRELFALADRPNHLYVVGSMGCASSLGLGLSMARPDLRIVVIDGDGAALMRMGNFATIGAYGGSNLIHIVLDNEVHDSTGGQATVSGRISFARLADACGYATIIEGDDLALLNVLLTGPSDRGPSFGHLKIRSGTSKGLPRPTLTPPQVRARLMAHICSGRQA